MMARAAPTQALIARFGPLGRVAEEALLGTDTHRYAIQPRNRTTAASSRLGRRDRIGKARETAHRKTSPPGTKGQVARMRLTVKDATVTRCRPDDRAALAPPHITP